MMIYRALGFCGREILNQKGVWYVETLHGSDPGGEFLVKLHSLKSF